MDKPLRFDWGRIPSSGAKWIISLCEAYYGIDTTRTHRWLPAEVTRAAKDTFEEIYHNRCYLVNGHRFKSCSRQLLMAILLFHDPGSKPAYGWILDALYAFANSRLRWRNKIIHFARTVNGYCNEGTYFDLHSACYVRCGRRDNEVPLIYFREAPPARPVVLDPYDDT